MDRYPVEDVCAEDNVFHKRAVHTSESINTSHTFALFHSMAAHTPSLKLQNEARLILALNALQTKQISSIRKAAQLYNVPFTTLADRRHGRASRTDLRANNHKLTQSEEQSLLKWILSMDARGYPPRISAVREAAALLLAARVGKPNALIGKNWPTNFVRRQPALKGKWTRKYDYKRAKCEDPAILEAWFQLVAATIAKYGIQEEDTYNFDDTGFALGIACTSRVVTGSDRLSMDWIVQAGY
jgi:hypothetical protein